MSINKKYLWHIKLSKSLDIIRKTTLLLLLCFTMGEPNAAQGDVEVDLFMSSTCSHCKKADIFFQDMQKNYSWLKVNRYIVNENKIALEDLYQHLRLFNSIDFGVPAIFFCNSYWQGFMSNEDTGTILNQALNYCHKKLTTQGQLKESDKILLQQWSTSNK